MEGDTPVINEKSRNHDSNHFRTVSGNDHRMGAASVQSFWVWQSSTPGADRIGCRGLLDLLTQLLQRAELSHGFSQFGCGT